MTLSEKKDDVYCRIEFLKTIYQNDFDVIFCLNDIEIFNEMGEHLLNVKNQKKKETQITSLIQELKPLITDIGDATLIVPLIKEYMDLGLKNDEHLIKMATIIQRALNTGKDLGEDFGLSEEEKTQLFKEIENFNSKSPKKI